MWYVGFLRRGPRQCILTMAERATCSQTTIPSWASHPHPCARPTLALAHSSQRAIHWPRLLEAVRSRGHQPSRLRQLGGYLLCVHRAPRDRLAGFINCCPDAPDALSRAAIATRLIARNIIRLIVAKYYHRRGCACRGLSSTSMSWGHRAEQYSLAIGRLWDCDATAYVLRSAARGSVLHLLDLSSTAAPLGPSGWGGRSAPNLRHARCRASSFSERLMFASGRFGCATHSTVLTSI